MFSISTPQPVQTASAAQHGLAEKAAIIKLDEGWFLSSIRDIPDGPAEFCGKTIAATNGQQDDFQARAWGTHTEGVSEAVYFFAFSSSTIEPALQQASATAAGCKQYAASGYTYTPMSKPNITVPATPKPAVFCGQGRASSLAPEYRCTIVLARGHYLVVASVWTDRQKRLTELVPWFTGKVTERLRLVGP